MSYPSSEWLKKKREQAAWPAMRYLDRADVLILDTETTGLEGEAVQIAVINTAGETLFDTLVKPSVPVEAGALAVHKISDDMLVNAPTFDQIAAQLFAVLEGAAVILIYNAAFDVDVLHRSARARGVQIPDGLLDNVECVMLLYAEWVGEWNPRHNNFKWQKLYGGDHTAHGDCVATLAVLDVMSKHALEYIANSILEFVGKRDFATVEELLGQIADKVVQERLDKSFGVPAHDD